MSTFLTRAFSLYQTSIRSLWLRTTLLHSSEGNNSSSSSSNTKQNKNHQHLPLECWNCSNTFDCSVYFCSTCGTLQPIVREDGSYNFYTIFGLKPKFDISSEKISKTFKDLQRIFHPDRYTQKTPKEREYSEQCSAVVNNAYQTLLDPLKRAKHLLELNNVKFKDNEGSGSLDKLFLMEIMELNEEMEDITNMEEFDQLEKRVDNDFETLVNEMKDNFGKSDFDKAKQSLMKARYFANIKEKLKDIKVKLISRGSN